MAKGSSRSTADVHGRSGGCVGEHRRSRRRPLPGGTTGTEDPNQAVPVGLRRSRPQVRRPVQPGGRSRVSSGGVGSGAQQQGRPISRGGSTHRVVHRAACRRRGLPRHAAVHAQGPQLPATTTAGADDPQTRRQTTPPGDRHDHRPGSAGLPEAGAGADLRNGFSPVQLRVPSESARS